MACHVEALIFCSSNPVKVTEIQTCLIEMFGTNIPQEALNSTLEGLISRYEAPNFAFQIEKIGEGYQFLTKPAYQSSISILLRNRSKKRLSTSALETLSIIAYKQPISKPQIEQIRGVNCDYTLQKLLEKELVEIKGKSNAIGRPLIYGTTEKFMNYFGLNSLKDLPAPKDFNVEENSIGHSA